MSKVRYAVVGCGAIATDYHLPALAGIDQAEFVIACDRLEERAREAAERFGARAFCTDYRRVMERADVDLVCIFTRVDSHAELAMAAAAAGKHIFVQKPLARSLAEGQAMVEVAKVRGVQLIVSFMHRYFDESLLAAEMVRRGQVGQLEFIRMRNATGNPRHSALSYGGALMDIGAHGIDLIRALSGEQIVAVCAKLEDTAEETRREGPGPPEERNLLGAELNAWMLYELSAGTVASHEVQWSQVAGTSRFQAELYGTAGMLLVRVPRTGAPLAVAYGRGDGAEPEIGWAIPELPGRPFGQAQHEALIKSIVSGEGLREPGADGMAVLKVCEAVRRSAESGRWVKVL